MKTENKIKLLTLIPRLIEKFRTVFETSDRKTFYSTSNDLITQIETRFASLGLTEADVNFEVNVVEKQSLEETLAQIFRGKVKAAYLATQDFDSADFLKKSRESNREYFERVMAHLASMPESTLTFLNTFYVFSDLENTYQELLSIYKAIDDKGTTADAINELLDQMQMVVGCLRGMGVSTSEINTVVYGS